MVARRQIPVAAIVGTVVAVRSGHVPVTVTLAVVACSHIPVTAVVGLVVVDHTGHVTVIGVVAVHTRIPGLVATVHIGHVPVTAALAVVVCRHRPVSVAANCHIVVGFLVEVEAEYIQVVPLCTVDVVVAGVAAD